MNYGRLEGAPAADELKLTGSSAVLHELIMTNHHHGQSAERTLAECRCVQITAAEVVPGDFRYHYSKQLDTFILWEVISVDRASTTCLVKTIDDDKSIIDGYWDGEQTLVDGFNKFYRPAPEDRARVEKHGFESDYFPMYPGMQAPARRHLSLKLSNFKPSTSIYKSQEESFWKKVARWLIGF